MDLERVTWITVHLLGLNSMSHSNDHFANLSRFCIVGEFHPK